MRIWLINHYAVPPQYYPLARPYLFAKNLIEMGHEVTIFAASTVHNSNINLIEGSREYMDDYVDGIHYVYIRCHNYEGNGIKRILNMCEFAWKLPGVCKKYEKPDAIVATSMPPMSCAVGIRLALKYKVKGIAEIADLWPESIVAYGIAGPYNPAVLLLRRLEKWIYTKSDAIVFTMEGAYDYIIDQGWGKVIPRSKVHYINNGVDLEAFDYNKEHYIIDDPDLNDQNTFKVVYTGSLRKANDQIYALFDAIAEMQGVEYKDYRFLIYGKGELIPTLEEICRKNNYTNVKLKGFVDKKYVPFILSKCDLNILNCKANGILKYGGSQNKLFEYLASGHPTISSEGGKYSVIRSNGCGVSENFTTAKDIAQAITLLREQNIPYEHIRAVAEEYDFKRLTVKLIEIIMGD